MLDINNKKLDDLVEKVEISIQQKSAHDSNFQKDIIEIKEHLKLQDSIMVDFQNKVNPMLRAFNEAENKKIVFGKFGVEIKNKSLWVIYFAGALAAIWAALKFGLKILQL